MTVAEAIAMVDELKPNMFEVTEKVLWLSRLDLRIKRQIIDTHEYNDGEEEIELDGYECDEDSDGNPVAPDTELLLPEPYAEMYIHWLEAQIDYYNMEYDGFNAANALFNSNWEEFRNDYNSSHMPVTQTKTYFY